MPISAPQSVNNLLELSDAAFVTAVYRAFLGRNPDADGMEQYLEALRSGVDKVTILTNVAGSQEARRVGARIRGVEPLLRRYRLERLPLIGALWKLIGRLNDQSRMLNRLENRIGRMERFFVSLPVSEGQVLTMGGASDAGDDLAERLHRLEGGVYGHVAHGLPAHHVIHALEALPAPAAHIMPVGPTKYLLRMRRGLDCAVARTLTPRLHALRIRAADTGTDIDSDTDADPEAGAASPLAPLSPQSRRVLRQMKARAEQDTEILTTPLEL